MRDHDTQGPSRPSDGPVFGPRATSRVARWRNALIGAGAIGGAVLLAVYASRGKSPPAGAARQGNDAGAAAAGAQPVTLTEEQARRIGVTYAIVQRGALQPEIRTVWPMSLAMAVTRPAKAG